MECFNLTHIELAVKTMADTAIRNEAYFTGLDAVVGDADFGASLACGFKAVLKSWDGYDHASISNLLLNVASTITGNAAGCSGTVWGAFFMRCGMSFRGKDELTLADVAAALKNSVDGISKRAGAAVGDKTLLDAINDVALSFEASVSAGDSLRDAVKKAADAAIVCRETTKLWTAKRGRHAAAGERSAGTYDPGIVAIGEMVKDVADALNGKI